MAAAVPIQVIDKRKELYDLLIGKLKKHEEGLFNYGSFEKTFKFFIGGYTLYKYYGHVIDDYGVSVLESPLLKTEDVDFKIILNPPETVSSDKQFEIDVAFLHQMFLIHGILDKKNEKGPFYLFDHTNEDNLVFKLISTSIFHNYESKYMDISIMKDYPSVNYFLEYKKLSLESSDIKDIKRVLLSPEWKEDYHPSKEFVDFNIIHLYVLTYLFFRENVVNPRLIKTPRLIARVLLILGNGTNILLKQLFDMLSHYHSIIESDTKIMTSKVEIVKELLNDPMFYYELLEKSKLYFSFNSFPELRLMYSLLNEKLIPFIQSEKDKYVSIPHSYKKIPLIPPPPPPPPPPHLLHMFLQPQPPQLQSQPPIGVRLGNITISDPPVLQHQQRRGYRRGQPSTPEEIAAAAERAERAWQTQQELALAAERRRQSPQSGGNDDELDYAILYLQNLLGKDLVYTKDELKDEKIAFIAEADSLFFIILYEKMHEIITSKSTKRTITRTRASSLSRLSRLPRPSQHLGKRLSKVSVGGNHKKKLTRKHGKNKKSKKNMYTKRNKKSRKN